MGGSESSTNVGGETDGDERLFRALDRGFEDAYTTWRRDSVPLQVLFSGGVDSGLLAWELRDRPDLRVVTVGVHDGPDLVAARTAAPLIGGRWTGSELSSEEVTDVARQLGEEFGPMSRTARDVLVALSLALRRCSPGPVLCGQGADELFLGYAHFRGLAARDAAQRAEQDLKTLLEVEWPRAQRVASARGISLAAPYLAPAFVDAARAIPVERRMPNEEPKAFFRRWAVHRGLPPEVARRPKRALQFGSGVANLLQQAERQNARTAAGGAIRQRAESRTIYPGPGPEP